MTKIWSCGYTVIVLISLTSCRRDSAVSDKPNQPQVVHSASTITLSVSEQNAKLLEQLQEYPNLEVLSVECLEDLQFLPDSIGTLGKLRELRIDNGNGCSMNPVLPESFGNLHSLETLVLFGAQDPRTTDDSGHPQPGVRHQFPKSTSRLKSLTYLDLGRNGFEEVPDFVKDLPNITHLGLAWNELKELPPTLTSLRKLKTLDLEGNDLHDLPDVLNTLPQLSAVKLGYNCKITQNPSKIRKLKSRFPKIQFDFVDVYDCPAKKSE
ncbi:MAG TPA: hypothetical protein VGJ85_08225 [Candidatus Nanopelagicaceae bacterium]|jgi:Leucine-rich repeat (LRR) protein